MVFDVWFLVGISDDVCFCCFVWSSTSRLVGCLAAYGLFEVLFPGFLEDGWLFYVVCRWLKGCFCFVESFWVMVVAGCSSFT